MGGLAWYGLECTTFHSQSDSRFGFSCICRETNYREAGSSNLPPLIISSSSLFFYLIYNLLSTFLLLVASFLLYSFRNVLFCFSLSYITIIVELIYSSSFSFIQLIFHIFFSSFTLFPIIVV